MKTLEDIANYLGLPFMGEGQTAVLGLNGLEEASNQELSFIYQHKLLKIAQNSKASSIICTPEMAGKLTDKSLIISPNPYLSFVQLLSYFEQLKDAQFATGPLFVHETAKVESEIGIGTVVGANSTIGTDCRIYPQVYIGNRVKIGKGCIIYPGVKIYDDTEIGNHVIIHSNAVIGSDGFGFVPNADGKYQKIPHIGRVVIEDNVEIGACTCIDRATVGVSIIKSGTKLDNLIQIAHNVSVGSDSVMAAQSGIAGSGKLGNRCQVGGQVAIVGHLSIADGTKIGGQSGVTRSVLTQNTEINGTPAHDLKENLKAVAVFRQLPELLKRIEDLERKLHESQTTHP